MDTNIKSIFKHLLFTHLLVNITNSLCSIANTYIAGNLLDSVALSCSSIIMPFYLIVTNIGAIHSFASEILCGKYMGVGNKKGMRKVFTNTIVISINAGFVITILSLVFAKPFLIFLGGKDIIDPLMSYFYAYCLGIPAIIIMGVLISFLHLENEGKYVTASVVLLAVLYAIFGYLFINVLQLGCFGFGLTSSLSNIIVVIFLSVKIIQNKNQIGFDIKELDYKYIVEMYKLGISAGACGIETGIRDVILNNIIIEEGGVIALAAYGISGSGVYLVDSVVTSCFQVCLLISSICVGEKNSEDLVALIKYVFVKLLPLFGIFVFTHFMISDYICSIFTNEAEVASYAGRIVKLYLVSTVFEILSDSLIAIYTTLNHIKFVNIFNILHCLVIHSLFAILFESFLHAYAVFSGYLVTEVLCFITIITFIIYQQKRFPKCFKDLVVLNDDFKNIDKYTITVKNNNDVVNISEDITDFCLNNNVDSRRSNLVGLFIEEMVTNIFEHGFSKKAIKDKRVNVFVMIENNKDNYDVTIRIRDNSIAFDPTSRSIIFNPDDPCKNIGLRIVSKLSNEMTYQNLFGFNNMIIKI